MREREEQPRRPTRSGEALALLKLLALGTSQAEGGRNRPMRRVIEDLRRRLQT